MHLAILLAVSWSIAAAPAALADELADKPLRVGIATIDITPPIGHRLSGYFYERSSTGTLDPLRAKAIVWEQGDERFAWVFCDLLGITSEVSAGIRDKASAATGIPRGNIFIAATHAHTGPLYFGPLRDYYRSTAIEKHGADPLEAIDFSTFLAEKIVATMEQAASAAEPVELAAGTALQPGLSFNRRYLLLTGEVKTNTGKLNPNIVRPAAPIDPEVALLQFRRDGKPLGGLTLFALHLDTTGGTEYSADFPYYLERDLQAAWGPNYVSLFAAGPCGDINHIDVSHVQPQKGPDEAERIGTALGATVLAALEALPRERPRLASASKTLQIPLQRYTAAEVAAARANLPKIGGRELPFLDQVTTVKIVWIDDWKTETRAMDVQAFRLSDSTALVALPGELFVDLGLAIKRRSPFANTIVVELSNDYPGYIPTRRAFTEGSYEVTNARIAEGGGELLVEAAVELLNSLHDSPKH